MDATAGATHAFGSVEGPLIGDVKGFKGCESTAPFDYATGAGRVARKKGAYHDAIYARRNTVVLFIVNHFGGIAREAALHLHTLRAAAKHPTADRTEYVDGGPASWMVHHASRISIAVVTADARRCLTRLRSLRTLAASAAAHDARRRAPTADRA